MYLWTLCLALVSKMSERYRPELHYMRGPGPKWLQKQRTAPARGRWKQPRDRR
jgi:hypothetical protein